MNDLDPLAALTVLLDDLRRFGDHPEGHLRDLLAPTLRMLGDRLDTALDEAREAVDGLVAEREEALAMSARFVQLLAGAAKESNAALSKLTDRAERAEAERDGLRTDNQELTELAHRIKNDRDAAREALARVEALRDTWRANAAEDRDPESRTLRAVADYLDAALAQPATDEEAGQ